MTALAIAASMTCLFVSPGGQTNDLAVTGWTATLDGRPCALKRGERHFVDHVFDGGWVFEGIDCLERHEAELSATFTAPDEGVVVAGLTGDWFYDLSVDGKRVFSTGEKGNGTSELGFWNNTAEFHVARGVHRLDVRLRNGMGGMMFAIGKPEPAPVRSVNPIGIDEFRAAYRRLWARGDILSRNSPARLADLAAVQRGIDMTDGDDFRRFVETGEFNPEKSPALDMINAAIDRILAEVPRENVAPGTVVAWYLYNMGFVVKTPGGTVFAVDLYAPRCVELAAICDFALVTHNHPDHAHLPFVAAMQSKGGFLRGKPVVSSFLYTRHFARSPKTFRFGDCMVETGVSDHNPHWKESVTPFRVTCGEGADAVTVVHAGDGWDGRQLAHFAPTDVAIVHVWPYDGHNGADTAAALKPGLLVLAHHQEMSHGFGIARFSFERTERESARVKDAGAVVYPVWGEKMVWQSRACREGKKRNIDIGLHNCPGYTSTGGRWIPPRLGMRELVFNVTNAAEQVSTKPNALFPVFNEDKGRFEMPPCLARRTDVVEIGVARGGIRVAHIPMGAFVQPADWDSFGLNAIGSERHRVWYAKSSLAELS